MAWNEHKVSVIIEAPICDVFDTYLDLERHPQWTPWLTVVWEDRATYLARMTMKKFGLTFSWLARDTVVQRPSEIRWESVGGRLAHAGNVTFEAVDATHTVAHLTARYKLPRFLASLFSTAWLSKHITAMLATDLNAFNSYMIATNQRETTQSSPGDAAFDDARHQELRAMYSTDHSSPPPEISHHPLDSSRSILSQSNTSETSGRIIAVQS